MAQCLNSPAEHLRRSARELGDSRPEAKARNPCLDSIVVGRPHLRLRYLRCFASLLGEAITAGRARMAEMLDDGILPETAHAWATLRKLRKHLDVGRHLDITGERWEESSGKCRVGCDVKCVRQLDIGSA